MKPQELQWISASELFLDPSNPRLAGHSFSVDDQERILEWLWKNKSVDELVDSLLASGYWPHEELFAAKESGRLVVVEGNRRLAAVKLLSDPELASRLGLPAMGTPGANVAESLRELPVLIMPRREIWQFIGFKHVNGPQAWDSIAKAEYIHRIHEQFGVGLDEISRSIGDRHETVVRLYSGYLVLDQARRRTQFDPEDSIAKKFPFSHLWTALGYASVRTFLGLDSERLRQRDPVPEEKLEDLRNFMSWLFGSRAQRVEPKVRRQNPDLRDFAKALELPRGVQILRAGLPLEMARDASLGDQRLFEDAISKAESQLGEAKRFVATGYQRQSDLLDTAARIEQHARSLHREMRDMVRGEEN